MSSKPTSMLRRAIGQGAPWLVVAAIVVAAVAGLASFLARSERVTDTSEYCAECHEDQAGEAHLPGHFEETKCQDCHSIPDEHRLRFVWATVNPDVELPEHGAVDDEPCTACHREDEYEWKLLMRTEGHDSHSSGEGETDCIRCHAGSLHAAPEPDEGCMSCHEDVPLKSEPKAASECTTCHVFGIRDREDPPVTATEQDTGWASRVTVDHVHGAADCRLCHNPHDAEVASGTPSDCTSCHRGDLAATAPRGPKEHGNCGGCHAVHGERERLPTLCLDCHARPGVEPQQGPTPDAVAAAAAIAQGGDAGPDAGVAAAAEPSEERGDREPQLTTAAPLSSLELEERTHQGRCPTCHTPHAFVASPTVCNECHEHEEQVESLRALPEGAHGECLGCHEPHQPPPDKEACLECHTKPLGRGVPGQHRDCLSCHGPHTDRPTFREACSAECHAEPRRGVRNGPARHRDCASCHDAHGDPDRGSTGACRGCHAEQQHSLRDSSHEQCHSCHAPHRFTVTGAVTRCGGCHTEPTAPTAIHRGECNECHSIHTDAARARQCGRCHDDVDVGVRQHECAGCHEPHQPATAATAECASCHRPILRRTRGWPSDSPHAGDCMECHETHAVQDKKRCGSCHEQQSSREHVGAHKDCIGCHEPHDTAPRSTSGWWAGCSVCHDDKARAVATADNDTHRHCSNCHDRPRHEAPACRSCHEDIPRQAAHQIREHRDCSNCHTTHGTRRPARPQCLGCHDDRKNHKPEFQWCQACHPFSGG